MQNWPPPADLERETAYDRAMKRDERKSLSPLAAAFDLATRAGITLGAFALATFPGTLFASMGSEPDGFWFSAKFMKLSPSLARARFWERKENSATDEGLKASFHASAEKYRKKFSEAQGYMKGYEQEVRRYHRIGDY